MITNRKRNARFIHHLLEERKCDLPLQGLMFGPVDDDFRLGLVITKTGRRHGTVTQGGCGVGAGEAVDAVILADADRLSVQHQLQPIFGHRRSDWWLGFVHGDHVGQHRHGDVRQEKERKEEEEEKKVISRPHTLIM